MFAEALTDHESQATSRKGHSRRSDPVDAERALRALASARWRRSPPSCGVTAPIDLGDSGYETPSAPR